MRRSFWTRSKRRSDILHRLFQKHWVLCGFAIVIAIATAVYFAIDTVQNPYRPSFDDPDPAVRADAIRRSSCCHTDSRFFELAKDENADVRILAADLLGGEGPRAERRAIALARLLEDVQLGVRRQAALSLGSIGADAWPHVRNALIHTSLRVRIAAILSLNFRFLDKVQWPLQLAKEIVPVLEQLAREDIDDDVRRYAKETAESLRGNYQLFPRFPD